MVDIRQTETQAAQANPNIISNLSGASTPPAMAQIQPKIEQFTKDQYDRGFVSGGESQQDAATKELFRIDQAMEQNYNPLPTPSWYVPNPADQSSYYANIGQGMADVSQTSGVAASNAERAYQTATAGLLDKFTSFYQMKQEEDRYKQDREDQKKKDEFESTLQMAKLGLINYIIDPATGERISITPEVMARLTGSGGAETAASLEKSIIADIQNPAVSLKEIIAKNPQIDPTEIANMNERVWGQLKESDEEIRSQFGFSPGSLMSRLGGGANKEQIANSNQLRDEYNTQSKTFVQVRDAYNRVLSADNSAAGDVSLIFGYMKILDPGSVVREGEFATAENTAGIPERVRLQYNKAMRGDRLSPEQRSSFKNQSKNTFDSANEQHQTLIDEYSRLAQELGLDPSLVIVDVGQAGGLQQSGGETVRVKLRSSGQTGTIPAGEFDPNIYERI